MNLKRTAVSSLSRRLCTQATLQSLPTTIILNRNHSSLIVTDLYLVCRSAFYFHVAYVFVCVQVCVWVCVALFAGSVLQEVQAAGPFIQENYQEKKVFYESTRRLQCCKHLCASHPTTETFCSITVSPTRTQLLSYYINMEIQSKIKEIQYSLKRSLQLAVH